RDQVVHREQVGQPVGIGLVLLEGVDRARQPLDQRLAAPGQVDEHRVEAAAEHRLVPGSRTASACTWSNARATWPISSADSTSIGATSRLAAESGVSLSCRTRSGNCTVAISSAPSRRVRSGRTRDLATTKVAMSTRIKIAAVK